MKNYDHSFVEEDQKTAIINESASVDTAVSTLRKKVPLIYMRHTVIYISGLLDGLRMKTAHILGPVSMLKIDSAYQQSNPIPLSLAVSLTDTMPLNFQRAWV
jgi:hypothetical protein